MRRGWPIGESLGSETALQQRFRVSRSVLREAVRLLEHHQVARMRRGRGGGLLVTEPDAGPATRAIVIYLEYRGVTIGDLLNARLLLEPLAASLAADRIDEPGIDRLRTVLRAEERRGPAQAPQDDFHVVIAERSKNPVLQLFIDVLTRLTARYAQDTRAGSASEAVEVMERTHHDHRDIVAAVTASDVARAKTLSERHVESVTAWLRGHHSPGQSRKRRSTTGYGREGSHGKLAEVLAATVADDIAASGWQVGSVFGSEAALLERYRVSRSVLREAVRLLEHHGIARTRRGPGGGLMVTKPQAQASIDTIALYLQYRKTSCEDLRLVRDAIEIDNVARVVERRDDADVREFLDTHRLLIDVSSDDLRQAGVEAFVFHTGLARLAGSTVLELFLRMLVELFRRNWASGRQTPLTRGELADVKLAHLRVIEAIAEGDESLARYRARRHLDAVASWWL